MRTVNSNLKIYSNAEKKADEIERGNQGRKVKVSNMTAEELEERKRKAKHLRNLSHQNFIKTVLGRS